MFIFICPYLNGSRDGARCEAALCIAKNNLIKDMENVNIKLCINKKRRFEICYLYHDKLRRACINNLYKEIQLYENRARIFESLT